MIRFCDKELFIVNEHNFNRGGLFTYFCSENHTNDILGVYNDDGEFIGIITYDRLLDGNISPENIIQTERIHTSEVDIWGGIKKILEENTSIIYLPVLNEKNELIYFAYDDYNNSMFHNNMETSFNYLERINDGLFIRELYPKIQAVIIYDLNEWAYRFYNVCVKWEIPVVVSGEKWKEILGIESQNKLYPDYATMKIYSEGTDMVYEARDRTAFYRFGEITSFLFIEDILEINRIYAQNQIKKKYRDEGKRVYICRIPRFEELENYTLDEYYRNRKVFRLGYNTDDENNQKQYIKVCSEKYYELRNRKKEMNKTKKNWNDRNKICNSYETNKYGYGENYIYLVGPCILSQCEFVWCKEGKRLPDFLQNKLDNYSNANYSIITMELNTLVSTQYYEVIDSLSLRENDMVIFIDPSLKNAKKYDFTDDVDMDLTPLYNKRSNTDEEWFLDIPIHTTEFANREIANWMFENFIKKEIEKIDFSKKPKWLQRGNRESKDYQTGEIDKYLQGIDKFHTTGKDKIGAIVMNCNPFTNGHKYLIDYARKSVDYLYIFVVEEDRSAFKFEDRIALVREGTREWENIKVIPSGQFILSYSTMPVYFEKEQTNEVIIDASKDIETFARYIAPELSISVRFAGTEPKDKITMQYNLEMKRTLSEFDIGFVEIPRVEVKGEVISASTVRKMLKENKWEELKELVPESTYNFLLANC